MSAQDIGAFFEKLQTDTELQRAFVAFGKEHGFAFEAGALTDWELDDVAGGIDTTPVPESPMFRTYRIPFTRDYQGIIDTNT